MSSLSAPAANSVRSDSEPKPAAASRAKNPLRKWGVACCLALLLSLLVELLVFNHSALFFDAQKYPYQVINLPVNEQFKQPMAVLSAENNAMMINGLDLPVKTVYLKMGYGGRTLLKGQLFLKDDAKAYAFSPVAAFSIVPIAERDDSGINPLTGIFENDGWGSPKEVSEVYLKVLPFGHTHELRFEFNSLRAEAAILAVELNKPLPVDISIVRLVLMSLAFVLCYAIAATKVRQQLIASSSRAYRNLNRFALLLALGLATFIFVAMSPWFSNSDLGFKFTSIGFAAYGTPNETLLVPMPKTQEQIANTDAYTQLLDSLLTGQFHIDYQADARIATMDNPYDASERAAKNIPYLFDRAYYDGKFYPYFGVTPLFLIYLPIYLLTGMVPAVALAAYIGTILALLGLHLGSSKLTELFIPKVNPLLFLILKSAFYCASTVFLVQVLLLFYALPYLTCCFCLGVLIWALLAVLRLANCYSHGQVTTTISNKEQDKTESSQANVKVESRQERTSPKDEMASAVAAAIQALPEPSVAHGGNKFALYLALFFMGVAIVGIAGSRPLLEAYVICLVPPCAWFLWRSAAPGMVKFAATLVVGLPVAAGAVALAYYNYVRFDSIFEFGQFKQFTSLDNNFGYFQWSFEYIKAALFHNFFENFQSSAQFPYVIPNETLNINLGNFSPSSYFPRSGVFAIPYFWLLPLIIIMVKRYRKQGAKLSSPQGVFTFQRLLVWALLATLIVAPICQVVGSFSAGFTMRYIFDITMIWTYVGLLAVLNLNFADQQGSDNTFRAMTYLGIMALGLMTLVQTSCLIFSVDSVNALFSMHPELSVLLHRIFAPLSVAF